MNATILNIKQFNVFKDACQEYMPQISVEKLSHTSYCITIPNDDIAILCHEKIVEYFQTKGGFDQNYKVTPLGLICEEIIDKFHDDMGI